MASPRDARSHWWQLDVDGPVRLTIACCGLLGLLLAAVGWVVGGAQLGMLLLPMGILAGGSLSLRLSNNDSMRNWSAFADRLLGLSAKAAFAYAFPIWIYIGIKFGAGFAIVLAGALSAMLWFSIGGTTSLVVALSYGIPFCRKECGEETQDS